MIVSFLSWEVMGYLTNEIRRCDCYINGMESILRTAISAAHNCIAIRVSFFTLNRHPSVSLLPSYPLTLNRPSRNHKRPRQPHLGCPHLETPTLYEGTSPPSPSPFPAHLHPKIGGILGPLFFNLSTLFTKVALSLLYLRLSPSKTFRMIVYAVMLVSILYCLLAAFTFIWLCRPIAKYWDSSITTGSCLNGNLFFLVTGCINSATDFTLLFLPIFIIAKLQKVSWQRKIGVALLLMAGSL
jgi:hypothetical protein